MNIIVLLVRIKQFIDIMIVFVNDDQISLTQCAVTSQYRSSNDNDIVFKHHYMLCNVIIIMVSTFSSVYFLEDYT